MFHVHKEWSVVEVFGTIYVTDNGQYNYVTISMELATKGNTWYVLSREDTNIMSESNIDKEITNESSSRLTYTEKIVSILNMSHYY